MSVPSTLPFDLPPLDEVLGQPGERALASLAGVGWRPYATPIGLDPEHRRLFNIDLSEPEMAFLDGEELIAVAHVEADRAGRVTLLEISASSPVPPDALARALLPHPGEPRLSGGDDARVWVWGPESGGAGLVRGEPVRLWICSERAYGDRLWATVSLVRQG